MRLEILKADYHRNGIAGEGFYAIIFKDMTERKHKTMIASLFRGSGQCAVYDIEKLGKYNIEFANGNSWRGDEYESALKPLLKEHLGEEIW